MQANTEVFRCIMAYGEGKFLKRIITYLYSTVYNEINIFHSVAQKHVLHIGSHKNF